MVRMLSAWSASLLVWVIGFAIVVRVVPRPEPGASLSGLERLVRVDLPWVLISLAMVAAAAAVLRDRGGPVRRAVGVLAVPLLLTAAGVAAPLNGQAGMLEFVIYVVEGVGGAAAGFVLVTLIAGKDEEDVTAGYW
ncbi:hypothetical protein LUW74_26015 [Actinomadura madurae]|uniref:hypothetical protein n=1 Tax=Actinomadura madurae TaxID=1993 RepID=UPI0020271626|nr:hypothetical protein [Actinomadura madurae]URN06436.1 hypothetical protein LUW74_26015 [Actinomadura madurae]